VGERWVSYERVPNWDMPLPHAGLCIPETVP
jgi:hypothetical protein